MDYIDALKFGGATVHDYESFGSYQGEWLAKVTYEGKTGWVKGSYGSCSGCDALQAEFGYESHTCGDEEYYNPLFGDEGFREGCPQCQKLKKKMISFGQGYLDQILTQEEVEKEVSEYLGWDTEAGKMLKYVKERAVLST